MKILFVAECDWFDSVVFDLHLIAEGMAQRNHKVYAIDHRWPHHKEHRLYQTIKMPHVSCVHDRVGVKLIRPGYINSKWLLYPSIWASHFWQILLALVKYRIDVVVIYAVTVNGWQSVLLGKLLGIPTVFRIIDKHHILVQGKRRKFITKTLEWFIYRVVDRIAALTPEYARYAQRFGARESKISLVLFPLDISLFQPKHKSIELMEELKISKFEKVAVFMGTLFYFTGVGDLVKNFDKVLNKVPDAKLVLVGDGPGKQSIEAQAEAMGISHKVIVTGYKPFRTMPDYINLADVCINAFPINDMTRDIFSAKLVQYLACGKPVVSTALPGITSLIPDGYGVLFVDNCEQMVEALCQILPHDVGTRFIGTCGQDYAQSVYNYGKVIRDFEHIVLEVTHGYSKSKRRMVSPKEVHSEGVTLASGCGTERV